MKIIEVQKRFDPDSYQPSTLIAKVQIPYEFIQDAYNTENIEELQLRMGKDFYEALKSFEKRVDMD